PIEAPNATTAASRSINIGREEIISSVPKAERLTEPRIKGAIPRPDEETPHTATPPKLVPRPKNAAERKARVKEILSTLDEMYPQATCALQHRNAWELLVATILSAQCTDKRVNEVTPALFAKYPTVEDFAHASQAEMANDIRSTGFFNNKSK